MWKGGTELENRKGRRKERNSILVSRFFLDDDSDLSGKRRAVISVDFNF